MASILLLVNLVWVDLGNTLSAQLHTFGLFIQLFGLLSVFLVLLSNQRLTRYASALESTIEQCIDALMLQPLVSSGSQVKSTSVIVLIKLLIFSLCNLGIYFSTKYLKIDSIFLFVLLFGMVLLYIYIWAWSFLLVVIYRLSGRKEPVFLGRTFEMSDYGLSMIALILFLLIVITIRDFINWQSKTSRIEKIALVSLPLVLAGTVFQLIAAFVI
jgi:hypothetical protein